jgi:site-specific recombinase XerD
MATVNFLYRSTRDNAPLNVRLLYRYNDKDYVIGGKTKLEVNKEYWAKQHNKKRPKDIEISNKQNEINQELNKIENHILNAFKNTEPTSVSKEWLKNQIDLYYNPNQQNKHIPTNLIEYIDFYKDYRKHELKTNAVKRCGVIQNKLKRFQDFRKKPILIKEIDGNFKNEIVDYFKSEGYSQNTMQRDLVYIKTFCKHARFLGIETNPQFETLKLEKAKVYKTFLSIEELDKIEKTKDLPEHLVNVRDWLIISCYSGQRISDWMRFTDKMIRVEDGKSLIEFTQEKTGKIMTIPLHKKILNILDRRGGKFPKAISDQKYNDYVKKLCKAAKLNEEIEGSKLIETEEGKYRKQDGIYKKWELVSSHIGRRSFATNFYSKMSVSHLIYITGHSTESEFRKYLGKSNKDLALEISNYF